MDRLPFEWFFSIPLVTRIWCCCITACGCLDYFGTVNAYKFLYFPSKVWGGHEYWRLLLSFMYFGPLSFNLVCYLFFLSRYSASLEESLVDRHRGPNYAWLLLLASGLLISFSTFITSLNTLGPYLAISVIYLWARRHPDVRVPFMGIFVFSAPYLPWALAIFGLVSNENSNFKGELAGIAAGHLIFFFEDIYPTLTGGKRPLAPPWEWKSSNRAHRQRRTTVH